MSEQETNPAQTSETERKELKEKFANNERPTGADFARMIDAAVIQQDDGLIIESQQASLNKPLSVQGDIQLTAPEGSEDVALKLTNESQLNSSSLALGENVLLSQEQLQIGDQLQFQKDGHMSVFSSLEVNHPLGDNDEDNGRVVVNHPESTLHVEGNVQISDSLQSANGQFTDSLLVGTGQFNETVLEVAGDANFDGEIALRDQAKIAGPVQIGQVSDIDSLDESALLTLRQSDAGNLLDIQSDHSTIVVDQNGRLGLGHSNPSNSLDVAGNVVISDNPNPLDMDHSLVVDNRIGIGTLSPQSRLDIRVESHQDALSLRQNELSVLNVRTGMDNSHASLNFSGDSQLEGELQVNKKATLSDTKVNGTLTAKETLEVTSTITGRDDLLLDGDSHIKGELLLDGHANMQQGVRVNQLSELERVKVLSDTELNGPLTVKDNAHVAQTLTVSTDNNLQPKASMHIKEDSSRASLRIDDNNGDPTLLVNNHQVQMGIEQQPIDFDLNGDMTISQQFYVAGSAQVDKGLQVHNGLQVDVSSGMGEGDLPAIGSLFEVNHNENSVFVAKADKLGLLKAEPEADIHIGGDVWVDEHLKVSQGLSVGIEAQPGQNALSVSDTQIHLDGRNLDEGILLQGDSSFDGSVTVGNWLSIDHQHMQMTPHNNTSAIKIQNTEASQSLNLGSGSIALNTNQPSANLHINGTAIVEQKLDTADVNVKNQLTVWQDASFHTGFMSTGRVRFNAPEGGSENVDMHLRQSSVESVALRIDQSSLSVPTVIVKDDRLGINTADPQKHFTVQGESLFSGAVTTQGLARFATNVQVENMATVFGEFHSHGLSQFDTKVTIGEPETKQGLMQLYGDAIVQGHARFADNAVIEKNLGVGTETPGASIHIGHTDAPVAFKIDGEGSNNSQLVVTQGKVGIGVSVPSCDLDVADDVHIGDELTVDGRVYLNSSLDVTQDTNIKSDLFVLEKSRLREQTILGVPDPQMIDVKSQLYIADSSYSEAVRIDSVKHGSIVIKDGCVGIGQQDPKKSLEVMGDVSISEGLNVVGNSQLDGALEVEENLTARGTLDVSKKSEFGSDVLISGDLHVEDRVHIEESLTVEESTELQDDLSVHGSAQIAGGLNVAANVQMQQSLDVAGKLEVNEGIKAKHSIYTQQQLGVGVDSTKASLHVQSQDDNRPLLVEHRAAGDTARALLSLTQDGDLGIGVKSPTARLDVQGKANISGDTNIQGRLQVEQIENVSSVYAERLNLLQQLKIGSGPVVNGISEDITLGGDAGLNNVLPTQGAVKSYIDNVVVPFGRGGKTYTISSQLEFDRLFNKEGQQTRLTSGTTVILLPLNNRDNGTTAYTLTQVVSLESDVSIIGFNPKTTVIRKQNHRARFELKGRPDAWVEGVKMEGFTFDGNKLHGSQNGGAFYLEYARDCQLNCHIYQHWVTGNGAGIYARRMGESDYTANRIQALYVRECEAREMSGQEDNQHNEGGAAWGLCDSEVHAEKCLADFGGAFAYCHDSQLSARYCQATKYGGGAYRCERLMLTAQYCQTGHAGKGGGAYYCTDLMCEGFWRGNNAQEGPHIYANNNLTDELEERHAWRGDYVGRKIDAGEGVWRVHNE